MDDYQALYEVVFETLERLRLLIVQAQEECLTMCKTANEQAGSIIEFPRPKHEKAGAAAENHTQDPCAGVNREG